ncbi:MAG: hypothetical protein JJU13_07735 [Balneolaceae bacterium]|jgi:hypothetical protein|nr:hypothetical protein [Balneolaceae bacterium]
MKEIVLQIPDDKYDFFMELISQLGLEASQPYPVPEFHKEVVRERIRTESQHEQLSWEQARKQWVFKDQEE